MLTTSVSVRSSSHGSSATSPRPEKTRRCRSGTRSPAKPAIPRSGALRRQFRPAGAVGRICPRADHLRTYALQQRGDSFASSDRAHRRSRLRRFLGGAGLSGRHSARIQTLRGAGTPVPLALRRRSRTERLFSVYPPDTSRCGASRPASELLVNVWDWDPQWRVEYSEDGAARSAR